MATIQLGNTKIANKLLSYCEKKAVEKDGLNCDVDLAKTQFKATRELWGKNDKVQAHHVIQSFKPNEVTPEKANEIGKELAKEIGKGHEVAVYTHSDTDHIHNHLVINSVHPETGKKYQSTKKDLHRIREKSDKLCKEHDLSVVKEHTSKLRYTLSEKAILEKGKTSWKDEIREVVDKEKHLASSMKEFQNNLQEKYDIDVKLRGKNISFKHPEAQRYVRGTKLGMDYQKEVLENGFKEQDRGAGGGTRPKHGIELDNEIDREIGRDNGHDRLDEELHKSSDGFRDNKKGELERGITEDRGHEQESSREDEFDYDEARGHIEGLRKDVGDGYRRKKERDGQEQQGEPNQDEQDRGNIKDKSKRNERNNELELERDRGWGE